MHHIEQTITNALTGRGPRPKRYTVVATNSRGESFQLHYADHYDAADYAAEVRSNGGTAKVIPFKM